MDDSNNPLKPIALLLIIMIVCFTIFMLYRNSTRYDTIKQEVLDEITQEFQDKEQQAVNLCASRGLSYVGLNIQNSELFALCYTKSPCKHHKIPLEIEE